ncbi:acyl-CoA dehydratase activase [Saccharicrinis sp. GN24d3]|uniref:acyl-CoA dehydratase activase n=1 Tax=Saccharicrinis sp. GN24d3 TaxID=3458416 RepID=UPI00403575D6
MKNTYYLGIDVGSVAVSTAIIDEQDRIISTRYTFHKGQIVSSLESLLKNIKIEEIKGIGYTSSTPNVIRDGTLVDTRGAYINAAKHFHPTLRSLLIIGAEKFGLITFDKENEYHHYKSNSSCAAGTGNFLDQQAERLHLKNIQEFSKMAYENTGSIPKIASRCAVFAKTDLIHAQQEGYSLSEICDGLSYGLAKNMANTVFQKNTFSSVVASGGVALNKAVIRHLGQITNLKISVDKYAHVYGALGAAMECRKDKKKHISYNSVEDIILPPIQAKKYFYPPLQLKQSDYPDFKSHETYTFKSVSYPGFQVVEVDVYVKTRNSSLGSIYMGIDIGSTSSKAVIIDRKKEVIAGFYTRTSGQPLKAVQVILESICNFKERKKLHFHVAGTGTTGSGRKFIGRIIGADIILNEITAHARAAVELDSEIDTIIEIGGQDSKFTILHDGMITFSAMNNVCAAGTGSFIEEQAKKLGCPLNDYSGRAEKVRSPLASDRCTVFMERDINHYLMDGYKPDEILAAVLHSTRENYLAKVVGKSHIGDKIFFQGATAKNKALVAAFEQKLNKPIMVSKYCHLTGALGVALEICDANIGTTKFRGLDLYKKSIPTRSEVCDLCTNHCKLKVAEIDGQVEAYGFLCGRDYNVKKYVSNKSSHFQLMRKRKELFRFKATSNKDSPIIGIPAGLHLHDEVLFWQFFFDLLSVKTVTSVNYHTPVKDGKNFCGAEFCAPMTAMYGHVDYLEKRADYIFLPVYLKDTRGSNMNGQYCYYTQFVSSVITAQSTFNSRKKILTPLLKSSHSELYTRLELYRMLKSIGLNDIGFIHISQAYEKAKKHIQALNSLCK